MCDMGGLELCTGVTVSNLSGFQQRLEALELATTTVSWDKAHNLEFVPQEGAILVNKDAFFATRETEPHQRLRRFQQGKRKGSALISMVFKTVVGLMLTSFMSTVQTCLHAVPLNLLEDVNDDVGASPH